MLREIVVNHERMAFGVAEIFAHRASGVGGDVLHWRWFRCRCRDDDGVIHGTVITENLHHLSNRRTLLSDRAINANQVIALAVDDGVNRDGRLASLPVANDQLALTASDWDHAVNSFESCGHRFADWLAFNNTGRKAL